MNKVTDAQMQKSKKAMQNIIEYWCMRPSEQESAQIAIDCIDELAVYRSLGKSPEELAEAVRLNNMEGDE